MNNSITITMLKELKLFGMAQSFEDMAKMPVQMRPAMESAVAQLLPKPSSATETEHAPDAC